MGAHWTHVNFLELLNQTPTQGPYPYPAGCTWQNPRFFGSHRFRCRMGVCAFHHCLGVGFAQGCGYLEGLKIVEKQWYSDISCPCFVHSAQHNHHNRNNNYNYNNYTTTTTISRVEKQPVQYASSQGTYIYKWIVAACQLKIQVYGLLRIPTSITATSRQGSTASLVRTGHFWMPRAEQTSNKLCWMVLDAFCCASWDLEAT